MDAERFGKITQLFSGEKHQENPKIDPTGKPEYTPAYREYVYGIYKDPEQGGRSFRRTGVLVDLPHQTIARWSKDDGWQTRIWEEDEREAAVVKRTVEMRMVNELNTLLDHAFELAYNGQPSDKTKAEMTKYMLGVMRVSPVQKVEQDIIDNRLASRSTKNDAPETTMTREELVSRIMAQLPETTEEETTEEADFREIAMHEDDAGD